MLASGHKLVAGRKRQRASFITTAETRQKYEALTSGCDGRGQHLNSDLSAVWPHVGVMFFAEPARAFANLRTALKPSGRLAFACWRKFNENHWL